MTMNLPRILAVTGVIALLASASPSASAATGGTPASAATWTATAAPLPANADHTYAQLNSVSCPTAYRCTAAGDYTAGPAGTQGLLLTRSAGHWMAAQAPLPAGAAADPKVTLGHVSCFSASVCVATGVYLDSSGNGQGLLLTGSGSTWTAAEAPLPANAASDPEVSIGTVSCASATSCVAVGGYTDSARIGKGLLVRGFGQHWTATKAPLPANAAKNPYVALEGLSCIRSTSSCVAVGNYATADNPLSLESFLITGSGSSWTATEAPLPANAGTVPDPNLRAVQCQSPSSCTAVGSYVTTAYTGGFLLTGSGSSWTATEAPVPPDASAAGSSTLWAESCPGPTACIATGNYTTTADPGNLMLVTASGSSLTASQAPVPGNAFLGVIPEAVACSSAAACVVTGQYRKTPAKPIRHRGFVVYGSGSSWTAIQAPVPRGGGNSTDVPAVSCAKNAPACIAVGYYKKDGNDQALLLRGPA